jgi:hypothetical protein
VQQLLRLFSEQVDYLTSVARSVEFTIKQNNTQSPLHHTVYYKPRVLGTRATYYLLKIRTYLVLTNSFYIRYSSNLKDEFYIRVKSQRNEMKLIFTAYGIRAKFARNPYIRAGTFLAVCLIHTTNRIYGQFARMSDLWATAILVDTTICIRATGLTPYRRGLPKQPLCSGNLLRQK